MKQQKILLILLILCAHMALAQQTTSEQKLISLNNLFISVGNYPGTSYPLSLENFRQLAPGSVFLQNDLSSFKNSRYSFFDNSYIFRAGATFSKKNEPEKERGIRHNFRLAATYGGGTLYSNYFWKENRYPADTLVSVKSGRIYVLDSVSTKSYTMEYKQKYFGIDASLIFYSPAWHAFSLYGGVGINGNFDFDNSVTIGYSQFSQLEQSESSGAEYFNVWRILDFDYKEENIPTAKAFSASIFLPLGVDMKLSKHERGLGKLHLYYEVRPLIHVSGVPELKAFTGFRIQHSMGFRFSLI